MKLLWPWSGEPQGLRKLHKRQQRWQQLDGLSPALQRLVDTPVPPANTLLADYPWLAFDFETSGMDAEQAHILSIGFVPVIARQIALEQAEHHYVASSAAIEAQTAILTHITPEMLKNAPGIDEAMEELFDHLAGHVAVVHGKMVESRFINRYLLTRYGMDNPPVIWLDTLEMGRQHQRLQQDGREDYRLASLRERLGLPSYTAHHALSDAVATAELAMAQLACRFRGTPPTLGDIVE
ncbi:exonuclease domain-containing protein [Mangrovibacter yixingensis]|uniref:exonuclease domain-containing protein n=1 Tax=Mangrovibacter yixingensis TaxID=1529639 RepID=UPI001CFBD9BE|nr:exonuclease domain-containing protein [Mangrovibacter yixingensis]